MRVGPARATASFAILLGAGVALAAVAVLVLLWYAGSILLTVFAGLLLSVGLRGLAGWLNDRTRLRPGRGTVQCQGTATWKPMARSWMSPER